MKVDQLLARFRLAGAARKIHERQFGKVVRKLKRDHENKLTIAQAVEFATRLDEILAVREVKLAGRKGQLLKSALGPGVGSNELYRLRLPAGADPGKRKPRLDFLKYEQIVTGLCAITGEPIDRLRGELLRGTSRDPLHGAEDRWSDIDVVVAALEDIVDRLSDRHRWAVDFQRTATVRLQSCGRLHWPLHEPEKSPPEDDLDSSIYKEWRSRMAATVDAQQMFYWVRPYEAELNPSGAGSGQRRSCAAYIDAGHLQGADFFFVPHACIGQTLLWDLPTAHADPTAHQIARVTQLAQYRVGANLQPPGDEWDAASQAPRGQLDPVNRSDLQYTTWLIAYPHHLDHSRIVPALYQAGEEGGAWLMPIDSDSLAAVADAVWYDVERDLTLLERLKELLLAPDGEGASIIERALDRTGPWLAHNPVLAHAAKARQQMQFIKAVARRASDGK